MWWQNAVDVSHFVRHVIAPFPLRGLRLRGVVQAESVVHGVILYACLLQIDWRSTSGIPMAYILEIVF